MYTDFGHIVTAAITPFNEAGALHEDEFRRLLRYLVDNGSDSVVVAGTTGESPTLSDAEKLTAFRIAVDELAGRAPVIAGTGSNDTAHAIQLTRQAVEAGVDGVLVVTPYYNKPPRDGLLHHFTQVARAAGDVPVIVYNIPARCSVNLDPDLIAQLGQISNVVAVKQANPDLQQVRELRSLAPDLTIYAGDDTSLMPMLPEGVYGAISVASHVVGPRMKQVCELWHGGREADARALAAQLEDVYETLNVTSNPIPVKAAMGVLGFDVGAPRLPLVEATGMQRERIRGMLERHELVNAHV